MQIYLLYWATRSNWGILSPPLWRRFAVAALLNIEKKNALETNFGEGGVNMPSKIHLLFRVVFICCCGFGGYPLLCEILLPWGVKFPSISTHICICHWGLRLPLPLASSCFCTVPESPPHAKKPTETRQAKSPFLVKITLLASSFCWTGYFFWKKCFHHPSMSGIDGFSLHKKPVDLESRASTTKVNTFW